MASLTIKEIIKKKKQLEIDVNNLLTTFEKESEIVIDYLNRRTHTYTKHKRVRLKKPTLNIEVNIDNDPRSL